MSRPRPTLLNAIAPRNCSASFRHDHQRTVHECDEIRGADGPMDASILRRKSMSATAHFVSNGAKRESLPLKSRRVEALGCCSLRGASQSNSQARHVCNSSRAGWSVKLMSRWPQFNNEAQTKTPYAMATISITPAAFAATASKLPKGSTVAGRPDDDGGYLVTLDQRALDRLRARRKRGESYSDAILRLAKG